MFKVMVNFHTTLIHISEYRHQIILLFLWVVIPSYMRRRLTPTTIPTRKPPKSRTLKTPMKTTPPFAPSPPPTRVEAPARLGSARNTKIKMENLSSSPPRLRSRIRMAQETDLAGPIALVGRSVPGIVVKEDATKIFTENIQTREESLKREMHDDVVEVDKIEDSNQVVEINIDEGDL